MSQSHEITPFLRRVQQVGGTFLLSATVFGFALSAKASQDADRSWATIIAIRNREIDCQPLPDKTILCSPALPDSGQAPNNASQQAIAAYFDRLTTDVQTSALVALGSIATMVGGLSAITRAQKSQ